MSHASILPFSSYQRHRIDSVHLPAERQVIVYLPEGYYAEPWRRFPVVYVHDGNNLFEPETSFCGDIWALDQALEAGCRAGIAEPAILVGIYNSPERTREYTWHPMQSRSGYELGGGGESYCRFVVEDLKPFIDAEYRSLPDREHTAVIGSSLGGLISFYFGLYFGDVFGNIGMMSPSLYWKGGAALVEARRLPQNLRVWVDVGTRESSCCDKHCESYVHLARCFVKELEAAGFRHFENLAFHIAEGADHSERAWAERAALPLSFFFPARQASGRLAA